MNKENQAKTKKSIAIALFLLLPFMVSAQMSDEITTTCEAKESSIDMVYCYEDAQNKISAEQGKWIIARTAIMFGSTFWAKLMASSGQGISLVVACNADKKANVLIDWQQLITHKQTIEVTYQTDKEVAITSPWNVSEDHKITFSQNPKFILQKLLNSNQLTAHITTAAGQNLTVVFNTEQSGAALAEMKRCNR